MCECWHVSNLLAFWRRPDTARPDQKDHEHEAANRRLVVIMTVRHNDEGDDDDDDDDDEVRY